MIPPEITRGTSSDAERTVFRLLRDSEIGGQARCFHSLNISEHDHKLVGEIDFLILAPQGVLVLEVKGGGVAREEGIWRFTDRWGREHRTSEGPFQQARSAMFSLRRRLWEELNRAVTRGTVFGYAVVTPDSDLPDDSAEWSSEMVLDRPKLAGRTEIGDLVKRAFEYWEAKTTSATPASAANLQRLGDFLRPDFDRVPTLRYRADQIYAAMEHLTEEQYEKLDLVEVTDRLMCEGGAGTGKTFLAAEVARREAARGRRVLLTCQSATLATFLRRRVDHPGISVTALDEVEAAEPFDVVVVDEGQDLLDFEHLGRLDALTDGGLEHGRWRFFYDANNQSSLFTSADSEALAYIRSLATAGGTLRSNCRNTTEIVLQTRLLTAADLGNPTAGHGPPVEYRYYESAGQQAAMLGAELRRLREEEVPPGDITVLSGGEDPEPLIAQLPAGQRSRLRRLDVAAAAAWPVPETTVALIEEFKGLENQFICVVDLRSVGPSDRDRSLLYVAMSRARAGLWIALDQSLKTEVEQAAAGNIAAVLEGVAHDRA